MPVIDTRTLVRPAFEAAQFTATKWDSAADKADFANALCRFIVAQAAPPALHGHSRVRPQQGTAGAKRRRPSQPVLAARAAPRPAPQGAFGPASPAAPLPRVAAGAARGAGLRKQSEDGTSQAGAADGRTPQRRSAHA